jgi:nicotinate phosphoribosyltransferase
MTQQSLALLTDLYQLTMAYGYWKTGEAERESVFHLSFRRHPFGGAYAVWAGLGPALAYLQDLGYDGSDLAYLASLRGNDDRPLFEPAFLDYLGALRFTCSVDAAAEGSVVFAHEPLVRVRGPMLQAQIVETALLTILNFQTLVATKATRVCQVARGAPILEFGLRRAQGPDGGVSASRAAYIGGCAATSNLLAGKLHGVPVRGTHAHSWVMFHGSEVESFRAYAGALPNNCVFLVDTYDTIDGIENAITVGKELRASGHALVGIRLDSGDLAHFSNEARRRLDAAGFPDARIVASNDLDEAVIGSLIEQGAKIDQWGVGTRLVTAYDQPALGGVYKLGAVRTDSGGWRDVIKLSEQSIKISTPGIQQVRRYTRGGALVADVIYDAERGMTRPPMYWDLEDPARSMPVGDHDGEADLLVPVLDRGALVAPLPSVHDVRARAAADLAALSPRTKRFLNPQPHPVGLDPIVHERKRSLVATARSAAGRTPRSTP